MGTLASPAVRQDLVNFLRMNQDIFAWSHEDMPGIDPSVIVHRLNVNPDSSPVRQKKRVFAQERDKAVAEEVRKLLEAGFIQEVYYPDWLANVVMVRKNNGKWRMCVDFTNLNRACPKDSYPLPRIDTLVDSAARHELLSFMDAFSGYYQIKMKEEDQEKTSFVTSQGLFCYKVMSFGLKNAGATYQRLMNKMFAHQIGRNVQVYVDDMLVKSVRERPPVRPSGDIQHPSVVQHEAEPKQVRVWGDSREILGLHGVPKRYRGQPGKSAGHIGTRTPEDSKGSAELERKSCGPKQIRLQSNR